VCTYRRWFVAVSLLGLAPAGAGSGGGQLPDLPVTKLDVRQPAPLSVSRGAERSDLDARKITLAVGQPTPIRDVILLVVRGSRFSTVIDSSITGTFTGELRDLTMRQALEAVLFPSALDYDVDAGVISVYPRKPETRLFEVDLLSLRRTLQHRTESAGPGVTVEMGSATATDVFAEIEAGVAALLSQSGRHHVDRRAGLVQVTDFADRLDQVAVYLESVQVRALRQVRVQMKILAVTVKDRARGLDLTALGIRPGSAAVLPADVDAVLRAIWAQGAVDVLATPQVLAMNNEPAVVRVDSGDEAAWTLAITPQISADDMVQLGIAPGFSRRMASTAGASQTWQSDVNTIVRVRGGETLILSGLRAHPASAELVVLLTPTIVGQAAGAAGAVR
jgi:type II secretory pathway component GspD/PulD (secretin)